MSMHFEVLTIMLGKVVSEYLSRVKNSKDTLNPICMMKNAIFWILVHGNVQDIKALQRRYIKCYKQSIQHQNKVVSESTSRWLRTWI